MPTEEESYLPYSEPYAVPIHRILCKCWNNELSADEALEEIMNVIETQVATYAVATFEPPDFAAASLQYLEQAAATRQRQKRRQT